MARLPLPCIRNRKKSDLDDPRIAARGGTADDFLPGTSSNLRAPAPGHRPPPSRGRPNMQCATASGGHSTAGGPHGGSDSSDRDVGVACAAVPRAWRLHRCSLAEEPRPGRGRPASVHAAMGIPDLVMPTPRFGEGHLRHAVRPPRGVRRRQARAHTRGCEHSAADAIVAPLPDRDSEVVCARSSKMAPHPRSSPRPGPLFLASDP